MTAPTHEEHSHSSKSGTINLRTTPQQRELIDRAAARLGMSRTQFMLESARAAAEEALLDTTLFVLEPSKYQQFLDALDKPVPPSAALKRLLSTPPPWKE